MSFTAPAALWLLLLVPLPLLLRRRPPIVRHAVSNLYLWRAAAGRARDTIARRRTRRSWTVAVQMACIGALALAIAKPVVALRAERVAFVFDASASMSARTAAFTRFDEARARARALIDTLSRSTRVQIILAAASPRDFGTRTASDPALASTIEALVPIAGRADLPAAIDVAARGGVDAVVVLSDTAPLAVRTRATLRVDWVRIGAAVDNSAITRVVAQPSTPGGAAGRVFVVLRHFGDQSQDARLEIASDGRVVRRVNVNLDPVVPRAMQLPLDDLGRVVTARLIVDDALALDNVRSALVPRTQPIRVALFGQRGSFLERALSVNPSVELRIYERPGATEMLAAVAEDGAEVVVCDHCADAVNPPVPVMAVVDGGGESVRGPLSVAAPDHPLSVSFDGAGEIATLSSTVAAPAGAEVVARVDGRAAISAADGGEHRTVTVHLDLSQSDFPLTPAFPIFVANALTWLTEPLTGGETTAGEPLVLRVLAGRPDGVRVVGPDGRPRDVRSAGTRLIVTDTDSIGAYQVEDGSNGLVVVNPAVEGESDLRSSEAVSAAENAPGEPRLDDPFEIGGWLALAGLALLVLEWRSRMADVV